MRCGYSVRPGAETRGGEVMGTGPAWQPFVPPGSELQQEVPETPAAADPSPEHLIAAVLAKVSESPGDPRVPTPAFQVIHVIRVADSILIAFMQPELGNDTLIYAMGHSARRGSGSAHRGHHHREFFGRSAHVRHPRLEREDAAADRGTLVHCLTLIRMRGMPSRLPLSGLTHAPQKADERREIMIRIVPHGQMTAARADHGLRVGDAASHVLDGFWIHCVVGAD